MKATVIMGITLLASCLMAGQSAYAGSATFIFDPDTPYLSIDDSPFAGASDFVLENFEDGLLNAPGIVGFGGEIRFPSSFTDSVDEDDGIIDGFGIDGHDYWAFFGEGISGPLARFEFDPAVLGGLPRSVGLVWTDGNFDAITFFEAFGPNGESLGIMHFVLGDDGHRGGTDEDRFFGVTFENGISAIEISATLGRIEIDHVQYASIIPLPAPLALGLVGLAGVVVVRRKRLLTTA